MSWGGSNVRRNGWFRSKPASYPNLQVLPCTIKLDLVFLSKICRSSISLLQELRTRIDYNDIYVKGWSHSNANIVLMLLTQYWHNMQHWHNTSYVHKAKAWHCRRIVSWIRQQQWLKSSQKSEHPPLLDKGKHYSRYVTNLIINPPNRFFRYLRSHFFRVLRRGIVSSSSSSTTTSLVCPRFSVISKCASILSTEFASSTSHDLVCPMLLSSRSESLDSIAHDS